MDILASRSKDLFNGKIKITRKKPVKHGTLTIYQTNRGRLILFPNINHTHEKILSFLNYYRQKLLRRGFGAFSLPRTMKYMENKPMMSIQAKRGMFIRSFKESSGSRRPKTTLVDEARVLAHVKKVIEDNGINDLGYNVENPVALYLSNDGESHLITTYHKGTNEQGINKLKGTKIGRYLFAKLQEAGITPKDFQTIRDAQGKRHVIDVERWTLERKKPKK